MARLLVLWLLNERALTGYEIKKSLTDDSMSFWFGLEGGSIYSVLKTLAKHGYAEVAATEQPGARPARTRYRITRSGREHYRSLLIEALRSPAPTVGPIDIVLAARGDLDSGTVSQALAEREKTLHARHAEMHDHRPSSPSRAIVNRNQAVIAAELHWLRELDHSTIT